MNLFDVWYKQSTKIKAHKNKRLQRWLKHRKDLHRDFSTKNIRVEGAGASVVVGDGAGGGAGGRVAAPQRLQVTGHCTVITL